MKSTQPPLMTDALPLRIETAELAGAEQLLVTTRAEIVQLLQQLCQRRDLVSLYLDHTDHFALTLPLVVDEDQLVLDMPSGELRHAVFQASQLQCTAAPQQIKLQFSCAHPRQIDWDGRPALAVDLPSQILRLQRRETYRLTVPLGQPLSCYLPSGHGDTVEVSLVDISIGGIGILGCVPGLSLAPGTHYHGIHIELPDSGTVVADIEIRTSFDLTLRNGIKTVRTGARFLHLPTTTEAQIQRYITHVERERLAREHGIE
ncbi:flagellar brake protein [Chitinimonas lacunae]|uniref:Flagellar brake protein YcgR n=1 Tax=Chitinimonas lacunae TaxID=1963018 RepID=A0ABV8MPV4_9NEIS